MEYIQALLYCWFGMPDGYHTSYHIRAGQHVPACSSHLCHMISREARMSASVVTAMGLHTALARPIPMTWLRHSHIQLALLKDK